MGGGGGGKGGGSQKSTTTVQLPAWMEEAFKKGLHMGEAKAKMGYVPSIGPDVAAFNDQQIAGMQGASDFMSAFGMGPQQDVNAMLPPPTTYAGGIKGYSSFPMYEDMKAALEEKYPGLAKYLASFSIDPVTGKLPSDSPWGTFNKDVSRSKKSSKLTKWSSDDMWGGGGRHGLGNSRS